MTKPNLKKLLGLHLGLFTAGFCGVPFAHELSNSLGYEFWRTDAFLVNCSTDSGGVSDRLEFAIIDTTETVGGGKMNVVVSAAGMFTQTGDQVRNDANYGPIHTLQAGNGPYVVVVHKLFDGNKVYTLQYHCKSASGAHTGTSLTVMQNQ
ncbi:MAG: hypothetical protein ACU843_14600 [Gammaproteobacteria bacterium]